MAGGPVRVLIVDDTPLFARLLAAELERCGGLHAHASGGDVAEVREQLIQYHPDVIVLDLALRKVNALDLLRKLRSHYPVPVIVTAGSGDENARRAIDATRRGALEAVPKPEHIRPTVLRSFALDLAGKIRMAACIARPVASPVATAATPTSFHAAGLVPGRYLVALGASTGGTKAIETLLRRAPADFPPVVIVQHMPAGFTRSFAARLNSLSPLAVSEAADGELLMPGRAVIARGDTQLIVRAGGPGWRAQYTNQAPVNRHCPSVDVLFNSVAAAAGPRAIGVLLTGMGEDGAHGLLNLRQAGALTIAQDRASCVVYGMPKVAVDLGAALFSAAPEDVPALTLRALLERDGARDGVSAHRPG